MREISKFVRGRLGLQGTPYPLVLKAGDDKPALKGRSWHYVTPGGRLVRYPSAYRRAWGKPVYVASTLRIEVGAGWLAAKGFKQILDTI